MKPLLEYLISKENKDKISVGTKVYVLCIFNSPSGEYRNNEVFKWMKEYRLDSYYVRDDSDKDFGKHILAFDDTDVDKFKSFMVRYTPNFHLFWSENKLISDVKKDAKRIVAPADFTEKFGYQEVPIDIQTDKRRYIKYIESL